MENEIVVRDTNDGFMSLKKKSPDNNSLATRIYSKSNLA